MLIFKQSRYIALLVGVILVSFSAISLMNPEGSAATGENVIEMGKLNSASHQSVEQLIPQAASVLHRTSHSTEMMITPMLYTTAAKPAHTWTRTVSAGWLSPEKLQLKDAAKKTSIPAKPKVTVVKASPPAAPAPKIAATGTKSVKPGKAVTQQHPPQHCSSPGPSYYPRSSKLKLPGATPYPEKTCICCKNRHGRGRRRTVQGQGGSCQRCSKPAAVSQFSRHN